VKLKVDRQTDTHGDIRMRIDLELHLKLQTKNDKQGQGKKESNYLKPKTSNEACSYQDLKSNKIWVNRASSKATKLFF